MDQLPKDPVILFSFVNTELRNSGESLEEFCFRMDVEQKELERAIAMAGFCYDMEQNRFR